MWHAVWSPAPRGNKGFSERDRAKLAALETAETLDLGPSASGYRMMNAIKSPQRWRDVGGLKDYVGYVQTTILTGVSFSGHPPRCVRGAMRECGAAKAERLAGEPTKRSSVLRLS